MAIEKKRVLRRIELTFTNDQVHPDCHMVYYDQIEEDGQVLMKKTHREVSDATSIIADLQNRQLYDHSRDPQLPI